jgi:hypothetical protein
MELNAISADDAVSAIMSRLHAAGFTILHDSENHGPTRDRAASVAVEQANADLGLKLLAREDKDGQGAMIHAAEEAAARSIATASRAMEVKHG